MANVTLGSARHDENGKLSGAAGDQLQSGSGNDFKGEVSMQPYYLHKDGWIGLRLIKVDWRHKAAERMVCACNNQKIGYSQTRRLDILKAGIETTKKTNCDCSSLVREVVKEATGYDPGNFTTADAKQKLVAAGLVDVFKVTSASDLMTGDILCSKKKGHIVVVVLGKSPVNAPKSAYYPKYTGKATSIVSALVTVGEKDTSYAHRVQIAAANGIQNYAGSMQQNLKMVELLKSGKLVKAQLSIKCVIIMYKVCMHREELK